MRIIMVCSSPSIWPEYTRDCDYAVVELTPQLMSTLSRRKELANEMISRDGSLFELSFSTNDFMLYSHDTLGQVLHEVLSDKERHRMWDNFAILPDEVDLSSYKAEVIEGERLGVIPGLVNGNLVWYFLPWNVDFQVQTPYIWEEDLQTVASGGTLTANE